MTIDRIRVWAASQSDRTAIIHKGKAYSYSVFSRAIEASRVFLGKFELPAGKTAVVLVGNLRDCWCLVLALRALGLNTIVVRSIVEAEQLRIRDVACVVTTDAEQRVHQLKGHTLVGTKVIVVPSSINRNIHTGDLPVAPNDAPPLGGNILYTSGTTGVYKKIMEYGNNETRSNEETARNFALTSRTLYHILNFGPWTGVGFRLPPAVWNAGGCVIFDQSTNAYESFFKFAPNVTILTPSMCREILQVISQKKIPKSENEIEL